MVKGQGLDPFGPPYQPHDLKVIVTSWGYTRNEGIFQPSHSYSSSSGLVPLQFGLSEPNPLFPVKQNHLISIPENVL